MAKNLNALFISHGGGPLPLLGDPGHQDMVQCLQTIAGEIPRPSAIVVVSAHWESRQLQVLAAKQPPLLYDYYGFPEPAYHIQYPCEGHPQLAEQIVQSLAACDIPCTKEHQRGFDHGVFVPLKIMYPEADIPCVQLSLDTSLSGLRHLQIGQALGAMAGDNILLLGSGFSFHNMRAFFSSPSLADQQKNRDFERWLNHTCVDKALSASDRWQRLADWHQAPGARYCHPREEHLLPLHVCMGVASQPATRAYAIELLNMRSSMYFWQNT